MDEMDRNLAEARERIRSGVQQSESQGHPHRVQRKRSPVNLLIQNHFAPYEHICDVDGEPLGIIPLRFFTDTTAEEAVYLACKTARRFRCAVEADYFGEKIIVKPFDQPRDVLAKLESLLLYPRTRITTGAPCHE